MTGARGITLLEVLLAVLLLSALSGGVFSFAWNLADRRTVMTRVADDAAAATAVFDRLEADLCASSGSGDGGGPGVRGDETSLTIHARGVVWRDEFTAGGGVLEPSDLQHTRIAWQRASSELRLEHGGVTGTLSRRVERLRFRYRTSSGWAEQFVSTADEPLPIAVEVSMWFAPLGVETAAIEPADEVGAGASGLGSEDDPAADDGFLPFMEEEDTEVMRRADRVRLIVVPDAEGDS